MKSSEFNFQANRGRDVIVKLVDGRTQKGILLGLMPDDIVVIEFPTKSGIIGLTELEYSEISDINISN